MPKAWDRAGRRWRPAESLPLGSLFGTEGPIPRKVARRSGRDWVSSLMNGDDGRLEASGRGSGGWFLRTGRGHGVLGGLLFASLVVGAIAQDEDVRRPGLNGGDRVTRALLAALDRNRDRKLSQDEIDRAVASLRALDRNADGVIGEEELALPGRPGSGADRPAGADGSARPRPAVGGDRRPGAGRGRSEEVWKALAEKYDRDRSGDVSKDEYTRGAEKFAQLDRNDDGKLTIDDLRGGRIGGGGPRGLQAGSADAPEVGVQAPDFELAYAAKDGAAKEGEKVRLSSFKGRKPVALVFGSYT